MEDCQSMSTPVNQKEKLSKEDGTEKVDEALLMYLSATRSDLLIAVSILSWFIHCASEIHLKAAKRVVRYMKGTINLGIKFKKSKEFKLFGFSDGDWARSIDDMKSTSGCCFSFGLGVFSWSLKKQETIAQSTVEAEFVATTSDIYQALWLRKILSDLHLEQKEANKIFVDNQAVITISYNLVFSREN